MILLLGDAHHPCCRAPKNLRIYVGRFIKDVASGTTASSSAVSIQALSVLENAVGPYRLAGYIITAQTDSAITLRAPPRKFSWTLFVLSLILLWPVAVVYLVWFKHREDRTVCVRITSRGETEESGFTLNLLERERRRRRFITLSLLISAVVIGLLCLIYVGINKR